MKKRTIRCLAMALIIVGVSQTISNHTVPVEAKKNNTLKMTMYVGESIDTKSKYTFKSSNRHVRIQKDGNSYDLKAYSAGKTTLTVKGKKWSGKVKITVKNPKFKFKFLGQSKTNGDVYVSVKNKTKDYFWIVPYKYTLRNSAGETIGYGTGDAGNLLPPGKECVDICYFPNKSFGFEKGEWVADDFDYDDVDYSKSSIEFDKNCTDNYVWSLANDTIKNVSKKVSITIKYRDDYYDKYKVKNNANYPVYFTLNTLYYDDDGKLVGGVNDGDGQSSDEEYFDEMLPAKGKGDFTLGGTSLYKYKHKIEAYKYKEKKYPFL